MTMPWLEGIGAGLSELSGATLDEKRRLRALQQAQAQFDAQQGFQEKQFGENARHNAAMEAFQTAEMQGAQNDRERLRDRQDLDVFRSSAAQAGVNYLDPQQAFLNTKQAPPEMGAQGIGDLSPAINALRQGSMASWQKNIDPTAQRLAGQNVAQGFIPGSESVGGAVLENKQYNPYSMFGAGMRGEQNTEALESQEFRAAKDDVQKAFYDTYSRIMQSKGLLENIQPDQLEALRANAGAQAERAMRSAAQSWSTRLMSQYPRSATRYSVEMLMGLAEAPGAPAPQTPTQSGGNRFLQGQPPVQTPAAPAAPQVTPPAAAPRRNRLIP